VLATSVQSLHARPAVPHDPGCVSSVAHVPLLQHVPLHVSVAEQAVVQVFLVASLVVSHAVPDGHCVLVLHPHVPPPVTARHAVPELFPTHVLHDPPPLPHAAADESPPTHVGVDCVLSQQPPLHGFAVQSVEHCPFVPHAVPVGQSLACVHPHDTPVQTWPSALVEQSMHVAPAAPHALAVPPPHVPVVFPSGMLQHDPVHGWLAEQVVVHV
jgi:hypothetical protein